MMIFNYPIL